MVSSSERQSIAQMIVIFFWLIGFGTTIPLQPLIDKLKRPRGVLIGVFSQSVFLPLWTFFLVKSLGISDFNAITYLIISSSPGGNTSNVWCMVTKASLDLSAAMTCISSFASAATMPLNVHLYSSFIDGADEVKVPILDIVIPAIVIFVGTGIGIWLRHRGNMSHSRLILIEQITKVVGVLFLAASLFSVFFGKAPNFDMPVEEYMMAFLMNGTTLIGGALVGRALGLPKPQCTSIGFEISTQNLLIPLLIFTGSDAFDSSEEVDMVSIVLLFGFWSFLLNVIYSGVMITAGWTRWGMSEELIEEEVKKEMHEPYDPLCWGKCGNAGTSSRPPSNDLAATKTNGGGSIYEIGSDGHTGGSSEMTGVSTNDDTQTTQNDV